jgi:hypothetical protein
MISSASIHYMTDTWLLRATLAITSKYTEFLPTRRSLPLSLTRAVLVSISVGSCGVKVTVDVSREIVFEGVVGTNGASRGCSGVR